MIDKIETEDKIRKNALVIKATFVSVILAAIVDVTMNPYLSTFIVATVIFIIMETSVSSSAYFLVYFVLATAAIYMK